MKRLVVFTGAGISEESGLQTFRGTDGLWMGYNVYEVASPEGWRANRQLVQQFYNMRRREVLKAEPNDAHKAIAELQSKYDVWVITQNVDDLHERAGSENVVHLHGEVLKMRSEKNDKVTFDIREDIPLDARAADGGYLRPHVVWFGEAVPEMERAKALMPTAEIFVVAGTSLQVYPAAGLIHSLPSGIPRFLIDPFPPFKDNYMGYKVIAQKASAGIAELLSML